MHAKRRLWIGCLWLLAIILIAVLAALFVSPSANLTASFVGYTNVSGIGRFARFSLINSSSVPISVRYWLYLQPDHSEPITKGGYRLGERGLQIQPMQQGDLAVPIPESRRRWQLMVVFVQLNQRRRFSGWYYSNFQGTWVDRLVPSKLKDVPDEGALSDWVDP